MKKFIYLPYLLMCLLLLFWTGISQVLAQTTVYYGTGAGSGGLANTHIGYNAGKITLASYNTFIGFGSGPNTTSANNTFVGANSGSRNTTGNYNTFIGSASGYYNTTGYYNTFLGKYSGFKNTTGSNNVFLGNYAGYSETGSNRLYIDNQDDSKPLIYGNFEKNSVSIGTKYTGNTYKLFVPGKVRATAYDVASDKRLKQDIHPLENALTKVQKVEGVSYLLKEDAFNEQKTKEQQSSLSDLDAQSTDQPITKTDKPTYYGFVAQDIQKVFPELVTEDEGMLAVNYMGMIPVLVEAIKELSAERDELKQELLSMKQVLIQKGLIPSGSVPSSNMGTLLQQNQPNPFNQSTSISYQAPEDARQVSLVITNLNGVEMKRFDNLKTGVGQVEISAVSLAAGTYIYTLTVDGQKLSSQRMILTR